MTRKTVEIEVPFSGFYESKWSGAIDDQEDSFVEYEVEEGKHEGVDPETLHNILFDVTDYAKCYASVASDYPAAFACTFKDETGLPMTAEFVEMQSPREYNFGTDRIFARVPLAHVYLWFRASREEGHSVLARLIKERCTSCSGFIASYSNDLDDWLSKPLREWDYNELKILLCAVIDLKTDEDEDALEWSVYERWPDSCYSEWSEGVDWPAFDAKVAEAKRLVTA